MSFASLLLAFAPVIAARFRPKDEEDETLRAEFEALRADHAAALAEIGSLRQHGQAHQLSPQEAQYYQAQYYQAQYQGLAANQLAAQQAQLALGQALNPFGRQEALDAWMNCTPGRADLLAPAPRP